MIFSFSIRSLADHVVILSLDSDYLVSLIASDHLASTSRFLFPQDRRERNRALAQTLQPTFQLSTVDSHSRASHSFVDTSRLRLLSIDECCRRGRIFVDLATKRSREQSAHRLVEQVQNSSRTLAQRGRRRNTDKEGTKTDTREGALDHVRRDTSRIDGLDLLRLLVGA